MISPAARAALHPALLASLRHGLVPAPAEPVAVGPNEWAKFELDATAGRIWGLTLDAAAAGAIELTPEQRTAATDRFRAALGVCLALERAAVRVTHQLHAQGIEVVLLKGPDTARRAAGRIEHRCFGDIDLLVHGDDMARAVALLLSAGATRTFPEVRPGWDGRFAKSVTMRLPDGWELDLHRTLTPGAFGFRIDESTMWADPDTIELLGATIPVLSRPTAALHSMYHLALGGATRLSTLRDVAQWVRDPELDPMSVVRLARGWRAGLVVERALDATAWAIAPHPERWATIDWSSGATTHDRRVIDRYGDVGSNALDVIAELPASLIPAYLTGLVWPSRESMAWRSPSRSGFLRRQVGRFGSAHRSGAATPGPASHLPR